MSRIKEGLHAGHRGRMRDKFISYGRDVFHTHELLEMLLFHLIPYKNTNDIARNLMLRFSTLDGVLSASRDELMTVKGVGPKIADKLVALGRFSFLEEEATVSEREVFDDYRKTGEFFSNYFSGRLTYEIVLLLLNNKMEYIDCASIYSLDYDSGAVKAKPFIDAALERGASVAVIAHNHPYGPAFPSIGDKATNDMIFEALSKSGVLLAEHYVVSGERFVGFMNNLATAFSQPCEVWRFYESKKQSFL